jgi:hypothetical protein
MPGPVTSKILWRIKLFNGFPHLKGKKDRFEFLKGVDSEN